MGQALSGFGSSGYTAENLEKLRQKREKVDKPSWSEWWAISSALRRIDKNIFANPDSTRVCTLFFDKDIDSVFGHKRYQQLIKADLERRGFSGYHETWNHDLPEGRAEVTICVNTPRPKMRVDA